MKRYRIWNPDERGIDRPVGILKATSPATALKAAREKYGEQASLDKPSGHTFKGQSGVRSR